MASVDRGGTRDGSASGAEPTLDACRACMVGKGQVVFACQRVHGAATRRMEHAWQPACLPMLSLCKCAASACVACCRALCCYTASGAHDTGAGEAPTTCATMYTDCELLMLLAAYEAAAPTRTPRTLALTSADTASCEDSSESDEIFCAPDARGGRWAGTCCCDRCHPLSCCRSNLLAVLSYACSGFEQRWHEAGLGTGLGEPTRCVTKPMLHSTCPRAPCT